MQSETGTVMQYFYHFDAYVLPAVFIPVFRLACMYVIWLKYLYEYNKNFKITLLE
jgi:hypothetical protein